MGGTAADISVWTGAAADGDWDTAGNWATAAGSPTTTVPSAGEGVVMDDRSANAITVAPSSGIALTSFHVTSGCNVGIGTPGTSLTNVTVDSGTGAMFMYGGNAHCYFNGSIDDLQINNTGSGGFHYTGGTCAVAENASGTLELNGGTITTLTNTGGVTLAQSGSTLTNLYLDAGRVRSVVTQTLAVIAAGRYELANSAGATALNVYGGYVNLQTDGTVTTLNGHRGLLDARGSKRSAPTITTANYWRRTFKLNLNYEGGAISVGTDNGSGVEVLGGPSGLGGLGG